MSGGQELEVRVNRGGEAHTLMITPARRDDRYLIGFVAEQRFGLIHSRPDDPAVPFRRVRVHEGIVTAGQMIGFHIRAPFRLIARMVAGDSVPEDVGGIMGPIGIGGMVTEVYQEVVQHGFMSTLLTMMLFAALINAAIGTMNLLPIPAMDGGRLVFLAIEGIRRKPVPPEREAMVHFIGIVTLLLLFVFIAYRDIARLL